MLLGIDSLLNSEFKNILNTSIPQYIRDHINNYIKNLTFVEKNDLLSKIGIISSETQKYFYLIQNMLKNNLTSSSFFTMPNIIKGKDYNILKREDTSRPLILNKEGKLQNNLSPNEFANRLFNKYKDFNRSYLFRAIISNEKDSVEYLTDLISSTEIPSSRTSEIVITWQGSKVKIPGKTEFNDWKITIKDDLNNTGYKYLHHWRDKIYYYKTSSVINIEEFKKKATLLLVKPGLSNDPLNTISRAYVLHGIFPIEISPSSLSYNNEQIITFDITFSLDYYEVIF